TSGFLEGLALAADWLEQDLVDGCVVVGAEETDWPILNAFHLFSPRVICSEGAGALYVSNRQSVDGPGAVELTGITAPHHYSSKTEKLAATKHLRDDLTPLASGASLLCDSRVGLKSYDKSDDTVWSDWSGARMSPKTILGEGLMAGSAWQCVAAIDALKQNAARNALVSIAGCLQQAVGACFAQGN
ncbi:MAG: hypothetical protein ACXWBP_10305, partial [Limisphaerales bacterium]